MSKFLYPIYKLKTKSYIKWWLYHKKAGGSGILSEILQGFSFNLTDTSNRKFKLFEIEGNSEQGSTTGNQLCTSADLQSSENIRFYFNKNLLEKTFTISFIPNEALNNTLYLDKSNGSVAVGSISGSANTKVSKTITLTDKVFESLQSATWFNFRLYKGGASFTVPKEPMIQNGSTATEWEPYTGGQASPNPSYPQEIHSTGDSGSVNEKVQNKNLLKLKSTLNTTRNNVEISYNEQSKKIKFTGTINSTFTYSGTMSLDEPLKPGTYVLSIDGNNRAFMYLRNSQGNVIKNVQTTNPVVTITEEVTSLNFGIEGLSNGATVDIEIGYQLEQGTTATDYVAHSEQNISFPLAQGQKLMQGDYLADDGIHHVMKEIRLGSSNNFYKDSSANGFNRFIAQCADMKSGNNNPIKCSHLIQIPSSQTEVSTRNKEGIASSSGAYYRIMLVLNETDFPNEEALNTWLSNNNVKLQYPLAEEVIDPYTEEQAAVWEQIKALRTYKPVTHISSEDETPAYLKIQYYKEG